MFSMPGSSDNDEFSKTVKPLSKTVKLLSKLVKPCRVLSLPTIHLCSELAMSFLTYILSGLTVNNFLPCFY